MYIIVLLIFLTSFILQHHLQVLDQHIHFYHLGVNIEKFCIKHFFTSYTFYSWEFGGGSSYDIVNNCLLRKDSTFYVLTWDLERSFNRTGSRIFGIRDSNANQNCASTDDQSFQVSDLKHWLDMLVAISCSERRDDNWKIHVIVIATKLEHVDLQGSICSLVVNICIPYKNEKP